MEKIYGWKLVLLNGHVQCFRHTTSFKEPDFVGASFSRLFLKFIFSSISLSRSSSKIPKNVLLFILFYYLNIECQAKNKTKMLKVVNFFLYSSNIVHNRLITDIKRFIVCAIKEFLWSRVSTKIASTYSVLCSADNLKIRWQV